MNITTSLSVANMNATSTSKNSLPIPFSNLDTLSDFLCGIFASKASMTVGVSPPFLQFVEETRGLHMDFPSDTSTLIDPGPWEESSNIPLHFMFSDPLLPGTTTDDLARSDGFTLEHLVETFFCEPTDWRTGEKGLRESLPSYKKRFSCALAVEEDSEENDLGEMTEEDVKPAGQEKSAVEHKTEDGLEEYAKLITTKIVPYVELGKCLAKSDAQDASSIGDRLQKVGNLLTTMGHLCAFQHAKYTAEKISSEDKGQFCKNFNDLIKKTLRQNAQKSAEPKTTSTQRANDPSVSVSAYGKILDSTVAVQEQYLNVLESLMEPSHSLNLEQFTPKEQGSVADNYDGKWDLERFDRLMTDLNGSTDTLRLPTKNPGLNAQISRILVPTSALPDSSATPYSEGTPVLAQHHSAYPQYAQEQPGYPLHGEPAFLPRHGYHQGPIIYGAGAPPSSPQRWGSSMMQPSFATGETQAGYHPHPQFGLSVPGHPFPTTHPPSASTSPTSLTSPTKPPTPTSPVKQFDSTGSRRP